MPKMHISRSKVIHAPIAKVYETLSNFNSWTTWSPWLIMEPEAQVNISNNAQHYEWSGKLVGAGTMKITSTQAQQQIDYDLTFLKPWKSKSKFRFKLNPQHDHTHLTWEMDTSLPFFMFWMKKAISAYIGMDYERGLALLKDYVEDGKVHSKLEIIGSKQFAGIQYIGIRTVCSMDQVGKSMKADFYKLDDWIKEHQDVAKGHLFSQYHQWNPVKNKVSYTAAVPVTNIPKDLPPYLVAGSIPPTATYTIRHTGSYEHLGNAWSTLFTMQRNKVFKPKKKIDPFEVYINEPDQVHDHELITEVHFPIKSAQK